MEVFSDYECPSCRSLYENTLRPMINDYVASGKVYLIHRDFPLPMHKYGYEAARWINAAARVGQFQNVEAALYDNQTLGRPTVTSKSMSHPPCPRPNSSEFKSL